MSALIVMGVSGCGKSSLAQAVANALQWPFVEGDAFHPPANQAKMKAGTPLTDKDRWGWLAALADQLERHPQGAVVSCSALKRSYRDRLRQASGSLRFAWLDLPRDVAIARVAQRGGAHFFPQTLVDNQFATLECPTDEPLVLRLDATAPLPSLTHEVLEWLAPTLSR
jgi:gluconokinase